MIEQIYMASVIFVFWPIFFIYLYFFYEWVDRKLNFFGTLLGALIWAFVWPMAIGVFLYKRFAK